jgi:N-acyl-D-amino-acid deacylase
MKKSLLTAAAAIAILSSAQAADYDLVVRGGTIYDGSGGPGFPGDVAVKGERIAAIAPHIADKGKIEIDAKGKAVTPGFVNMLSHIEESVLFDKRALSDLVQGVTLEVLGELSMGPLSPEMKKLALQRQTPGFTYDIDWMSLGGYLDHLQKQGISPNVASFVGAGTVRTAVLGEADVEPTPAQLETMKGLVKQAMQDGAMGLTDALIYAPETYAKTPELIALAKVSAACGGIYTAHMRSEGDRFLEAIQETIDIAEASGAPAEIYHFKQIGRDNWGKLDAAIKTIEAARAKGTRITADMYTYTAGATGLNAAFPPWVQDGGLEKWIERLKDSKTRAKVIGEMREAHPKDWENIFANAGAEGTLLLAVKNPDLKPLLGKTVAEIAKMWKVSPEDAVIDLVIKDGSAAGAAYFIMSEDNVRREVGLPWMSFGSDEAGPAPEGIFLQMKDHPRAYGNFARLLGHYVRDNGDTSLADAVRRLTSLPSENLSIAGRGRLKPGYFADIVVFDPKTIADHATYENSAQLATGVEDVVVNGGLAVKDGKPTGSATGKIVRGRANAEGCKASASEWKWAP